MLSLALAGAATFPAMAADAVVATDADSGKTISVALGTSLTVKLTGHHGSGYYWRIDTDLTPQLILSGRTTEALDVPGAPETTIFTFKTDAAGSKLFKASNLKAGVPPPSESDVSFTVEVTAPPQ